MSDTKMPQKAIDWMVSLNWGYHHDEWHYTRRFYYWPVIARDHPDPEVRAEIQAMVDYATQQHWQPAQFQEGVPGSGLDFLAMHRAMVILALQNHPELSHYFRGWETPPQDPASVEDPVPGGAAFDAAKARAVVNIRDTPSAFETDDDFGRYLETPVRPTAEDPTHRDPNPELGLHNYLHNRWTDDASEINLGDPKVNIFNARFWRLHGWIDYQWWRFRLAKQADDANAEYQAMLQHYLHMMGHPMHLAHHEPDLRAAMAARPRVRARIFEL